MPTRTRICAVGSPAAFGGNNRLRYTASINKFCLHHRRRISAANGTIAIAQRRFLLPVDGTPQGANAHNLPECHQLLREFSTPESRTCSCREIHPVAKSSHRQQTEDHRGQRPFPIQSRDGEDNALRPNRRSNNGPKRWFVPNVTISVHGAPRCVVRPSGQCRAIATQGNEPPDRLPPRTTFRHRSSHPLPR